MDRRYDDDEEVGHAWLRCRSYAHPTFALPTTTGAQPPVRDLYGRSVQDRERLGTHLTCEAAGWLVLVQEEGQGGQRSLVGFMYA